MKFMMMLALSLSATAAFAFPKIGDTASFSGQIEGSGGGGLPFTQTLTLTSFDAATSMYSMKVTIVFRGQTQESTQTVNASDLLTSEQVADVLANCAAYGGTAEDLTVPAGVLKTCAAAQDDGGKVWIADVPFGIAKQISHDEDKNTITIELASSVSGN